MMELDEYRPQFRTFAWQFWKILAPDDIGSPVTRYESSCTVARESILDLVGMSALVSSPIETHTWSRNPLQVGNKAAGQKKDRVRDAPVRFKPATGVPMIGGSRS
jgi:hypothetical protein